MWFKVREIVGLGVRWLGPEAAGGAAGWWIWSHMRLNALRFRRQTRVQEELQAYGEMDVRLGPNGEVREAAARVCRAMSERSAFRRAAVLVCEAEGRLGVAATAGMEDAAVESLEGWAESLVAEEGGPGRMIRRGDSLGVRVGSGSFAVILGRRPAEIGYARGIVIPLWTSGGRMLGVLAVCADGLMTARRSALQEALAPLEALAMKLARSMENATLGERLMRAEKLAGVGLLAGGMAHALTNPLTAVLGFAELIEGTTEEPRVKQDAAMIVREALKMRRTVESLLEFWRPAGQGEHPVDVLDLVGELAAGCADQLESRGVRLVVQGGGEDLLVRGNRHRLRQVLEHLLNNAAQALAGTGAAGLEAGGEQAIRVSVSGGAEGVRMVVSDTGPGFRDPGRVFDASGMCELAGTGMGLSLCYGIVHEHGGEIRAFNLEPHGAGVEVELPALRGTGARVSEAAGATFSG